MFIPLSYTDPPCVFVFVVAQVAYSDQQNSIGTLTLDDLQVPVEDEDEPLEGIALVGRKLFFDTTLSDPATIVINGKLHVGEACATCHNENAGGTIAESSVNLKFGVAPGVSPPHVGHRKVPSIFYIAQSPTGPFAVTVNGVATFRGGILWDGRGRKIFDTGAFNDQDEQGNKATPSPNLRQGFSIVLAGKIKDRPYADLFKQVFGSDVFEKSPEVIFTNVMLAIQAYIDANDPFTSKWDAIQEKVDGVEFTREERIGRDLFFGKATCSTCHSSADIPRGQLRVMTRRELFTSYTYWNIGVPRNPTNPFYQSPFNPDGVNFVDVGLAGNKFPGKDGTVFFGKKFARGLFKVPTLRNISKFDTTDDDTRNVKAMSHNGGIKSLRKMIYFKRDRNRAYSLTTRETRIFDTDDGPPRGYYSPYYPPEVKSNVYNHEGRRGRIGNLDLDDNEIDCLVAFCGTFSDGFFERN